MLFIPGYGKLDGSAKSLLLANLVSLALALLLGFDLPMLVWVYLAESMAIGIYAALSMAVGGFRMRGKDSKAALLSFLFMGFFIVHYGMFHAGYLIFLLALPWFSPSLEALPYLAAMAGVFLISHGHSFYLNSIRHKEVQDMGKGLMGRAFMDPYARIVPMHLTIIFSGLVMLAMPAYAADAVVLSFFILLKSVGDLYAHQRKHHRIGG